MTATPTVPWGAPSYPARVSGAPPDPQLSRWLWLVKWLLVVPHVVVLFFLWLVFVVLWVVALVAILVTGRYPRGIFEVNVGILRWAWRVSYYSFGAFATDRYPPFSFTDDPDYPARLEVDYPEHLSRGLALVKWWLLAIPHYLVVSVLLGGGPWVTWEDDSGEAVRDAGGPGLITLLAVIAVFWLLFTSVYPRGLFDLVMGLNRWVLRVTAYAALMTDVYPPLRLDMGGQDPAGTPLLPAPGPVGR